MFGLATHSSGCFVWFLASFIGLWASSYSVVLVSLLASQRHIRALGEKYFALKSIDSS